MKYLLNRDEALGEAVEQEAVMFVDVKRVKVFTSVPVPVRTLSWKFVRCQVSQGVESPQKLELGLFGG